MMTTGAGEVELAMFERGLCPRNRVPGEVSEGAVETPSDEWASTW
jgi:hypothetical protein